MHRDLSAPTYPLARAASSALYRGDHGVAVQVTWLPLAAFAALRLLRRELSGIGDEAYRIRFGGALTARRDQDVVLVTVDAPQLDDDERDRISVAVANAAFEPG